MAGQKEKKEKVPMWRGWERKVGELPSWAKKRSKRRLRKIYEKGLKQR